MIQKAISVRSPWWWLILHAGKDVENRDWYTNFRGTIYLHASKWWSFRQVCNDLSEAFLLAAAAGADVNWLDRLRYRSEIEALHDSGGSIVGSIDIVDCVSRSGSPWFFGEYGFVLANPVAFERPIPCKGALGFFTVPDDVLRVIDEASR